MDHPSNAKAQQDAEVLIREAVEAEVGVGLLKKTLAVGDGGARIEVDGVDEDESIFVEIYARQGKLDGGQKHKVKGDALKLITVARNRQTARLILAFADEGAAFYASNKSWLAAALQLWGVEVFVAEIDEEVREGLRVAQVRQVMINPPDAASD